MRRANGFTVLELMVVVAIIVILSVMVIASMRSSARDRELAGAAGEIAARIAGLRSAALSDGEDRIFVFVDAPGSDASRCWMFNQASCARFFVLRAPSPGWQLTDFDPDSPAGSGTSTALVVDEQTFSTGIHLDLAVAPPPPPRPAPFTAIPLHDPDLTGVCGDRNCFAVRFTSTGDVAPEYAVPPPAGGAATKTGYAFVLGTDLQDETRGAELREVLVTFPSGIFRSFAFDTSI